MMATTHALIAAAVVAPLALIAPELGPVAVAAAMAGGVFPDLDLYAGHRRTLHFPVYYWIPAALAVGLAAVAPGTVTVAVAAFAVGAALHAGADVLGGGLELRPWLGQSERAVYDHWRGRWLRPRRWVRYDGAPEDVGLGCLFAIPVLTVVDGPLGAVVVGAVAISVAYALVRKQLPWVVAFLAGLAPPPLRSYLPERFFDGGIGSSTGDGRGRL